MRIFRAKKIINIGITQHIVIFKGTMFFVDGQADLPIYNDVNGSIFKENWEELDIQTRFGYTKLFVKE